MGGGRSRGFRLLRRQAGGPATGWEMMFGCEGLTSAVSVPTQYTAYTIHCTAGPKQWRTEKRFSDVRAVLDPISCSPHAQRSRPIVVLTRALVSWRGSSVSSAMS